MGIEIRAFFSISHRLSMVELRPSSSLSTGCVVYLRGDWAVFCHTGSGRVGRVRSAREKSLEILLRGWELNPGHEEDRQWAIPLSYLDPGHWGGQTVSYPTELSWPGPQGGQTELFHWAIMTRATGEDRQWAIPLSYHDWLIRALGLEKWAPFECVVTHWVTINCL